MSSRFAWGFIVFDTWGYAAALLIRPFWAVQTVAIGLGTSLYRRLVIGAGLPGLFTITMRAASRPRAEPAAT